MASKQSQSSEDESELGEVEKLESEVTQMVQKIRHYRTTLPDKLRSTLSSILSAQRPLLPTFHADPDAGVHIESSKGASLVEEDQETVEKIQLLKHKISSNVSALPIALKRLNECIVMIDKLDSYDGIVHPAFKRRRTS